MYVDNLLKVNGAILFEGGGKSYIFVQLKMNIFDIV